MPLHHPAVAGTDVHDPKLHQDFKLLNELFFPSIGLKCLKVEPEPESAEYGACRVELEGRVLLFRVARITPRKIGQFVTVWKRVGKGPIQPYDESDPIDTLMVSCRSNWRLGLFVFPKAILCRMDVFSRKGEGGKRAIRVYPPWDKPTSSQALRTQAWQLDYFLDATGNQPTDTARARMLYGLQSDR